jgi:hypothetical protein
MSLPKDPLKAINYRQRITQTLREKYRLGILVNKHSPETRLKISQSKKGVPLTPEHRHSLSLAHQGKTLSRAHIAKIVDSRRGYKPTGETREKIRQSHLGQKLSIEHRQHLSISHVGKIGPLSSNWQGGISHEPYPFEFNDKLKNQIRERDHHTCQLCHEYGHAVHHIDYDKQNCSLLNLITLCIRCNFKVNFKRDYWTKYFRELLHG